MIKDRAIGCLVGLAIGDALGTPVEFKERDTFPPVTGMQGGGAFRLKPGEWTDDTSMALALADSILKKGTIDKVDLIERFIKWYMNGEYSHNNKCFDIGTTTSTALRNYIRTKRYTDAANETHLSGNGSLMRLAPVLVRWHNADIDFVQKMAWKSSVVTHGADSVNDSIAKLTAILYYLINGGEFGGRYIDKCKDMKRKEVKSSGYCVDTLEAAIWAVANTSSFDEAVLLAVNLGDDADTVGAVAGQIAGAKYGFESINPTWIKQLAWNDRIINIANKLHEAGEH